MFFVFHSHYYHSSIVLFSPSLSVFLVFLSWPFTLFSFSPLASSPFPFLSPLLTLYFSFSPVIFLFVSLSLVFFFLPVRRICLSPSSPIFQSKYSFIPITKALRSTTPPPLHVSLSDTAMLRKSVSFSEDLLLAACGRTH